MKNRLINKLFEDQNFTVDSESVPYIVRDIINMNYWNTCGYHIGYKNNKRIFVEPSFEMKLIGIITKEYYRHYINAKKDETLLTKELKDYIEGNIKQLKQLKYFSMDYRRNDSQYFHKDGQPTWLDCTSRASYAWKYLAQNGYMDFDGKLRALDANKIISFCQDGTAYPEKGQLLNLFSQGQNKVKEEIFSQKAEQYTIEKWVYLLDIKIITEREWLFEEVKHVKTDPYKNNEKRLLSEGRLLGNNEAAYGYYTSNSVKKESNAMKASSKSHSSDLPTATYLGDNSSTSDASHESRASRASNASNASNTSCVSDASRASSPSTTTQKSTLKNVSHDSAASDPSNMLNKSALNSGSNSPSWFDISKAIGKLVGLDHPPVFKSNKFGLAGHWKINKDLVENCELGWFDPFSGHGESPLYAKKHNKNYLGFEINEKPMKEYILPYIQKAVDLYGNKETNVKVEISDSSIFRPDLVEKFDLCYTSPPYFDFEDYGFSNKVIMECTSYDEFHKRVTVPVFQNVYKYLIKGGILALQTEKNKALKNKWLEVIKSIGFVLLEDTITGQENNKYSKMSRRDQALLIFVKE